MKRKKKTQSGQVRVKREKIEEYLKLEKLSEDETFEEELKKGSHSTGVVVKAEPMPESIGSMAKLETVGALLQALGL